MYFFLSSISCQQIRRFVSKQFRFWAFSGVFVTVIWFLQWWKIWQQCVYNPSHQWWSWAVATPLRQSPLYMYSCLFQSLVSHLQDSPDSWVFFSLEHLLQKVCIVCERLDQVTATQDGLSLDGLPPNSICVLGQIWPLREHHSLNRLCTPPY